MRTDRIVQAACPRKRGYIAWNPAPASLALLNDIQAVLEDNTA
jgi:hypothetical protein